MLVICEDCAKKYNIDESRIRGNRARFTCNECGHIIIVDKSDLSRPLVRGNQVEEEKKTSTVDLLKEMEAPLTKEDTSSPEQTAEKQETKGENEPEKTAKKKKKEATIPGYFLIAGLISFVLVNGGIAFILLEHYSNIPTKQMEQHSDMFMTAGLILLGTWAVSFATFFIMGITLAKKVKKLSSAVTRISQGEKELNVSMKGPTELAAMADALSELCRKTK